MKRLANVLALDKEMQSTSMPAVHGQEYSRRISRMFGVSVDEYNDMLASQSGKCAICLKKCRTGKRLAVDHCHQSGRVRGLLCAGCNTALGQLNDDIGSLERAIEYLKSAK